MNKTNEEFVNEIRNKFNGDIIVVDTYLDQRTKITFHCNKCDVDFIKTPQSILHTKHGCSMCARKILSATHIKNHTNSKYGMLVDVYPNIAKQWDYDKNINLDIADITVKSGQRAWWVCTKCGESYQAKVCAIVDGSQKCMCHSCYVKTLSQVKIDSYIKNKGSFAEHYPELLGQWCYELNGAVDPYQLTDKSNKNVWWECIECGHKWKTSIAHRTENRGCPYCARHTKSTLQIKIEDYIRTKYNYELLNEHSCTLKCYNPQTGYRLLYDNELIINDNIHLIIECNGQQHYEVCGWSYTQAKADNCSPEEILRYQQWKDNYKKEFAINSGFYYCEIPYTDEGNDLYKEKIDSTIHKILTQQND